MLFGRGLRAETRSKAKEDIKRVANAIHKVRKWEKKWVALGESTMKVYKWVPAANQAPREPQKPPATVNSLDLAANSQEEKGLESQPAAGVSSIPKRMLSYMNDENSMDSVASSATSDNNDDLSRDSQNYISDSSRSAVNNVNSNSGTPTLAMMQHGDPYLPESDSASNMELPSLDTNASP